MCVCVWENDWQNVRISENICDNYVTFISVGTFSNLGCDED